MFFGTDNCKEGLNNHVDFDLSGNNLDSSCGNRLKCLLDYDK